MDRIIQKGAREPNGLVDDSAAHAPGDFRGEHQDGEWDAGDMGCGELVMELRIRLKPKPPGYILKLTARDPGALEDLPAWCRLTGHHLMHADHPVYLIRRKEE